MTETIHKEWHLPFPVSKVYQAWVSSSTVIPPATAMDVLPEVGGHYRLIMEMPDFSGHNEGTFLVVEPESRVVYTWEWNNDGEVSKIDVSFAATQEGTLITLIHDDFDKAESVDSHDAGWDSYIEGFREFLSNSN